MRLRKLVGVAAIAALPVLLPAQEGPRGYHAVACVKVKPGASAEFQKFAAGDLHKLQQSFADSGRIAAWFLLKYAMPQGSSAPCDYVTISLYAGAPLAQPGADAMGAALEKAGVAMSGQQFIDKRSSLVDLVNYEMWQNQAAVGTLQKGDYVVLNHMKVQNLDDWIAYEKKVWRPVAESLVKDGIQRGWTLNVQLMPGGSDVKYQASTADVYPSMEAIFKGFDLVDLFKKVHPDLDVNQTMERFQKLRTIGSAELLSAEDVVRPSK